MKLNLIKSYRELPVIRVTSLHELSQCPRNWAHRNLSEETPKSSENWASKFGTGVHGLIEEMSKQVYLGKELDTTAMLKYMKMINQNTKNREDVNVDSYTDSFFEKYSANEYELVGLEEEVEVNLPIEGCTFVLRGHCDMIFRNRNTGQLVIHDHKTNRKYEGYKKWRDKIQPSAYAYMVRQLAKDGRFGEYDETLPIKFCIGYINHISSAELPREERIEYLTSDYGTPIVREDKIQFVEWEFPRIEDDIFLRRTERLVQSLSAWEDANWPGIFGEACAYCSLRESCKDYALGARRSTELLIRAMSDSDRAFHFEFAERTMQAFELALKASEEALKKEILLSENGRVLSMQSGKRYCLKDGKIAQFEE